MIRKILISLIAALTISGNLIAMRDYDNIDLKLGEKPEHVPTHKWCKRKAKELVEGKIAMALTMLNLLDYPTELTGESLLELLKDKKATALLIHDLLNRPALIKAKIAVKAAFENETLKNAALSEQEFGNNYVAPFVKDIIFKIITRPYVQKKLDITKIYFNKKNIITVIRKNNPPIKFFIDKFEDSEGESPAYTDGYNIIISDRYGKNAVIENKISEEALEATIGHELGHIKFQHKFEEWFLRDLYEKRNYNDALNANCFNNTIMSVVNIAHEIQADIFGTFGDLELTEKMQEIFLEGIEIGRNHPRGRMRIKYLSEIYSSIRKELGLQVPTNTPQTPPNEPKTLTNNKPIKTQPTPVRVQQPVIIKKPAPVKQPVVTLQAQIKLAREEFERRQALKKETQQKTTFIPKRQVVPSQAKPQQRVIIQQQVPANTKPVANKPQVPAKPTKKETKIQAQQPVITEKEPVKPPVPAKKQPVIINKQAPVNAQVNKQNNNTSTQKVSEVSKVREMAKKFDKFFQDKNQK